ncbi:hypothetical protein HK102_000091 [Quaeritorhiza haematococci]|nr:hypothetical protein HK102_000091 [Quaeritorhiza haematococci]
MIVFVYNVHYRNLFWIYLGSSLVLAFVFGTPPLFLNTYGFEESEASCWYKNPNTSKTLILKWFSFYGPIALSILLSSVMTGIVIRRLLQNRRITKKHFSHTGSTSSTSTTNVDQVDEIIRRLASRVVFYPLIPLVTQAFNVIWELDFFFKGRQNFTLLIASYIATSSQGTLTAIVFFTLDPAFTRIRRTVFGDEGRQQGSTVSNMSASGLEQQSGVDYHDDATNAKKNMRLGAGDGAGKANGGGKGPIVIGKTGGRLAKVKASMVLNLL